MKIALARMSIDMIRKNAEDFVKQNGGDTMRPGSTGSASLFGGTPSL